MSVAPARPAHIVVPYRARFDECGPDATLRASCLLRWAQDAAWIHSERLGFGREWYFERGLAWVVRGLELHMLASIRMGTTADVETRVTGFRRVIARRRTEFRLEDGSLAAWAHTDWVMTDVRRQMPTRVPARFPSLFETPADGFQPTRVAAATVPRDAARQRLTVRPQDLDPMAHANNAVYVEWFEEALFNSGAERAVSVLPRTYRLEYLVPAAPAQSLIGAAWPAAEGEWRYRLGDDDDRDLFRAELSIRET
jgi:acyl-CoA thioesterase FadM